MKKFLLSGAVIVLFAFYTFLIKSSEELAQRDPAPIIASNTNQEKPPIENTGTEEKVTTSEPKPKPTTTVTKAPTTPAKTPTTKPVTPAPTPTTPKTTNGLKDGTFTGNIADASYGDVQVSAKISNGKIVDITFLSYPNDRSTSLQKSKRAMPILISEAISTQSSQVDIVSGATYTSRAFMKSLTSALAKART